MNAGTLATLRSRSALVAAIYVLAQRPNGVSAAEVVTATADTFKTCHNSASGTLSWMTRTDRVARRKVKEGRTTSRFYADQAVLLSDIESRRENEWRQKLTGRSGPKVGTKRPDVAVRNAQRAVVRTAARQPLPAMPIKAQTEVRITSLTKITIAPAFIDRRWAPDVVCRVVDPNECRPWARAATERRA